jgi:hypothetical protein
MQVGQAYVAALYWQTVFKACALPILQNILPIYCFNNSVNTPQLVSCLKQGDVEPASAGSAGKKMTDDITEYVRTAIWKELVDAPASFTREAFYKASRRW